MNRENKIRDLKQQVLENVAKNDDIICKLCDEIIVLAKQEQDTQSIAFAYIWRADHYFYVHFDLNQLLIELENAKQYIDTRQANELLEKYYTMFYLFHEYTYDVKSSLKYSLEALKVAEKANIGYRIGVAYGNIGNIYFEYDCYEEAFTYTRKALDVIKSLSDDRPGLVRLLLNNIIILHLKAGRLQEAKECINELASLPLEAKDLKIYVDYVNVLFFAAKKDKEKALYYLQQLIDNDIVNFANRSYAMEFLMYTFEAMIKVDAREEAASLLKMYEAILQEEEYTPKLTLCKMKIMYAQEYKQVEALDKAYKECYDLYEIIANKSRELKVQGLRMKMDLSKVNTQQTSVKKKLDALEKLVNFDELTQVFNRRYFNIKRNEVVNDKSIHQIGFVIFDVDYFKEYNDYYGHIDGDEVLFTVAQTIKENSNEQMIASRYGGDEFVVLAWNTNNDELHQFVDKVRCSLKEKAIKHERSRCSSSVTLSIGYGAQEIAKNIDSLSLFEKVDKALYHAKEIGRNNAKSILDIVERKG